MRRSVGLDATRLSTPFGFPDLGAWGGELRLKVFVQSLSGDLLAYFDQTGAQNTGWTFEAAFDPRSALSVRIRVSQDFAETPGV